METSAAPETSSAPMAKLSFKEVISSAQKQNSKNKNVAGTSEQPPPPRLITLSTLGNKYEDAPGKRTRSLGTVTSEPAQKKPPQNSMASTSERAPPLLEQPFPRNQDKEKEVEEEVKKSCQNIQWTRGPLPKNVDHWFYDLRTAGIIPPASLVAASRAMVLKWKNALGGACFAYRRSAGGAVMSLEHAHRTFKALTRDLPISGWVSRACAKHQSIHGRACPLIYF
jgi:hypothetical protein